MAEKSEKILSRSDSNPMIDKEMELILLGIKQPDQEFERKYFMIYPNDRAKVWWDVFISLILIISVFTAPLDIAFPDLTTEYRNYLIFINVVDIIFLIDIFINFISAYQDENYQIIDDRKMIAKEYIRSWFFIDVLAILPFDLLIRSDYNQLVRFTRIGKIYKLIKITRLIRLVKILKTQSRLFASLKTYFNMGSNLEKFSFSFMIFVLLSHTVACLWIFVAEMTADDDSVNLVDE
jgi:hypothetical protein